MWKELKKIFNISELTKGQRRYLFAVLLIGFALRIGFILETQEVPFSENLISDSKIYDEIAHSMLDDGDSSFENSAYFMAPAYPYFLSFIYSFLGDSYYYVKVLQAIFSSLVIFFIFVAGRRIGDTTIGLIGATLTALYSEFIFYSGLILSETLQVFVISLMIVFLVKSIGKIKTWEWLIIGLLIGIAALFRGNILIFPFIVVVYLLFEVFVKKQKEYLPAVFSLVIGIVVVISPFTIRNYVVSDDIVLLTSNGGINFYLGNNEEAEGVFKSPKEFDFQADMSGEALAEANEGKDLSPSEVSSYWFAEGMDYITSNPGAWVGLMLKKAILFFDQSEFAQSTIMDSKFYEEEYSNILKLPLVSFLPVFIFFVVGLYYSFSEREKNKLIYILFVAFSFATMLFFVNGRFRLGIIPVFILFSSIGVKNASSFLTAGSFRKFFVPVSILVAFFVISTFIISKPKITNYDAYIELGKIELENQNFDKALLYFNKSLTLQENYQAYANIGNAFAMKGQFERAINFYQKSLSMNSKYALTHFNLGLTFAQMGQLPEAISKFKETIRIDPKLAGAYQNLGVAYYIQEDYENSLKYFNEFLKLSDDEEVNKSVLQDIEDIKKQLQK